MSRMRDPPLISKQGMNILLIEYLSEIELKTKKATDKADPLLDLSCRWPLMYVWINHPVVRACGLIPDLRSLFHLNRFDRLSGYPDNRSNPED